MYLKTVSALDALTDTLRDRILAGDLAPGEHLVEKALADEYSVARHTLRIALQSLEAEGLLTREPRRGVFVTSVAPEDVIDIFRGRVALELEAVHVVIRNKLPLDGFEAAYRHLEEVPDDVSWTEVIDRDFAFHYALIAATESPRLARIYAALQAETRLTMARQRPLYDTFTANVDEHRPIYEAVRDMDEKSACTLLRHHIEYSGEQLATLIAERDANER